MKVGAAGQPRRRIREGEPGAERGAAVSVHEVEKWFDKSTGERLMVLAGISLELRAGETVALVGPSGCGKTTLLRLIAGLECCDHGGVWVDGLAVTGPCPSRFYMFQEDTAFPWLRAVENAALSLRFAGVEAGKARRVALKALGDVGLEGFEEAYSHQLSGGMRRRVTLAQAIVADPVVLLLDEPFGALDPGTRAEMQKLLRNLWQAIGMTILFVTHDMEEAMALADRICVLSRRPARVVGLIEVPVKRASTRDLRRESWAVELREQLEEAVSAGADGKDSPWSIAGEAHS